MKNKRYFNEVAEQWDKMRRTFFSEAVREKAISTAKQSIMTAGWVLKEMMSSAGSLKRV